MNLKKKKEKSFSINTIMYVFKDGIHFEVEEYFGEIPDSAKKYIGKKIMGYIKSYISKDRLFSESKEWGIDYRVDKMIIISTKNITTKNLEKIKKDTEFIQEIYSFLSDFFERLRDGEKRKELGSKKQKIKEGKEFDWLVFAQAYFQSSLVNIRILERVVFHETCALDINSNAPYKEFWGNMYKQPSQYLIFPILFNFKHGIEIYLKIISGLESDSNDFYKVHDLVKLYKNTNIENEKLEKIIIKYYRSELFTKGDNDKKNSFERYPQHTPYDTVNTLITLNSDNLNEILKDIEYVYRTLRDITRNLKR